MGNEITGYEKMSKKKKHILPNGCKVEVLFEGSLVGRGTIVEYIEEQDDMYPNRTNLFYKVEVELNDFERMLGLDKYHVLNDFEVRPIKE